jgi:quercetin dioxygenase-like cupin family protein
MKTASLFQNLSFNDQKPAISVLLETDFTKEIRIAMRAGQMMKEHKTSFPIVVQVARGSIDFGVRGEKIALETGDMIALEGSVPHDLFAVEESVVRLTLSKSDDPDRVKKLV